MHPRGSALIPLLAIVLGIAAVVVVAYYSITVGHLLGNNNENTNSLIVNRANHNATVANTNGTVANANTGVTNTNTTVLNLNTTTNTNSTNTIPTDWDTYTNDTYHFTIQYPNLWVATENSTSAPFHVSISGSDWNATGTITLLDRYPFSTSGPAGAEDNIFIRTSQAAVVGGKAATEYLWTTKATDRAYSMAVIFDELPVGWPNDHVESSSNLERYINISAPESGDLTQLRLILSTFRFTN